MRSKPGHFSDPVPQKSAPFILAPTQTLLSPVLDELSTSATQRSTDAVSVLTTPEAVAAARDLSSTKVGIISAGDQEGTHCILSLFRTGPFSTIKRETGYACLGTNISSLAPVSSTSGTAPPWSLDRDLSSSELEVESYSSFLSSHSHYSPRHTFQWMWAQEYHRVHGQKVTRDLRRSSGPFGTCGFFLQFPELMAGVPIRWSQKGGLKRILLTQKGRKSMQSQCRQSPPPPLPWQSQEGESRLPQMTVRLTKSC